MLKPNEKEWDAYCTGDNIVMLNLISEAPKCADEYHSMCIEQLLVDIVAEKSFKNLYSRSEEPTSINHRKEKKMMTVISNNKPVDSKTVPIHLKVTLTVKEAAEYSNIGINKLENLLRAPRCPFVLYVGNEKLVKRKEFEKFISESIEL